MTPDEIQSRVLYRDGLVLIINKPPGIPVHAGPKGGPNLEESFKHLRFGLPRDPSLAHRLDHATSGCLVLGRHRKALAKMGRLFQHNKVEKTYWAVVEGAPPQAEGVIDQPLRKQSQDKRSWWMEVHPEGMVSVTEYRVLGQAGGLSWVEFRPKTGRTHQIRVHAAFLGCPVLGDPVYGSGNGPLHLHSRAISFPLYASKPPVAAEAPVPEHMETTLKQFV